MKLSVFAVLLQDRSFDEACKYLSEQGVQAVEIGCGGYPGKAHVDAAAFLKDPAKIEGLKETLKKYNLEIAALSTHGNPVHPDKAVAKQFHDDFEAAVLDVKMEGMDGIKTLKTLRMLLPRLQVIMLTGHGSTDVARQALSLGACDYLTKPCELSELMAKLQEVLRQS